MRGLKQVVWGLSARQSLLAVVAMVTVVFTINMVPWSVERCPENSPALRERDLDSFMDLLLERLDHLQGSRTEQQQQQELEEEVTTPIPGLHNEEQRHAADCSGDNRTLPIVEKVEDSSDFRRDIAQQLLEVAAKLRDVEDVVNAGAMLKLQGVIERLDPRYSLSLLELEGAGSDEDADTCGEVYLGREHGFPHYQEGFTVSPQCPSGKRDRPISSLVSILLLPSNRSLTVLAGIRRYSADIRVFLAAHDHNATTALRRVKVIPVEQESLDTPGRVWNELARHVRTPYALIGRDLSHFTEDARLHRLVYLLRRSSPVGVAAGAARNLTGHWTLGCQQTDIKNYFLRFAEGYQHSAHDCMFCDHVSGPFLVKTEVLKQYPFDEDLPSQVVFQDWFLQMKQYNILTVNCPDVMFFTNHGEELELDKRHWLSLAKKWEVSRVFVPPDQQVLFSCQELSLSCDPWDWTEFYLLPTCCFEQVALALRQLASVARATGMKYELDSGSQLAAVKLQGHSPWDLDGDFQYESKYYKMFEKQEGWRSETGSYLADFEEDVKKFKLYTPAVYLEMWGVKRLSGARFLPKDVRGVPTLLQVLGEWVPGQANPGLYARNKYGPRHLKHALFYLFGGHGEWEAYSPGSWATCPRRHHGCLSEYPADGSLHVLPHFFRNLGLRWDRL